MGTRISLFIVLAALTAVEAWSVTIDTVPVGYVGNAPDQDYAWYNGSCDLGRLGSVSYAYRIGTYEVTNAQFVEFLNAKHVGFSSNMSAWHSPRGGILPPINGSTTTYTVQSGFEDKPVVGVSYIVAMQFANWMNNGQGNADINSGAYTIPASAVYGDLGAPLVRNPGATWFLPNADEWYKAAYYQPAWLGGDVDNYWLYATRSNTAPTPATADAEGNITNPGPNVANYAQGATWNNIHGNVTTVGSAGPESASFFGTYDQAGNVNEWVEAANPWEPMGSQYNFRGGSYIDQQGYLQGMLDQFFEPDATTQFMGFRLATVPEPSSFVLTAVGLLLIGHTALRKVYRHVLLAFGRKGIVGAGR